MTGLLIKDFQLMKMQKKFFLVVIAMALFLSASWESSAFVVGYLSFLLPSFSLSTISYDEFDNGNAFLFTLPISRKTYVLEKYCFALLLELASAVVGIILAAVLSLVKQQPLSQDIWIATPVVLALVAIFLAVMLPLQLKYGAEKGRVVMILVGGGGAALVMGLGALLKARGIDVSATLAGLYLHPGLVMAAVLVLAVLVLAVSVWSSTVILEKKEF